MKELHFAEIPILSGLDRISLAKLIPHFEKVEIRSGEIIFRQGDAGDCLYIIVDGIVRVFLDMGALDPKKGRYKEIACLESMSCFGEMALLTGEPRSADVQAMTNLVLLKLCKDRFDELVKEHPCLGVNFAGLLANRLLQTDAVVSGRRELVGDEKSERFRAKGEYLLLAKSRLTVFTDWAWREKKLLPFILIGILCMLSVRGLRTAGMGYPQVMVIELLLTATLIWSMNFVSYHAVAIALPIFSVLFGVATPKTALSGFASSSWFLVLGVFAIAAAISKTGLLYRLVLIVVKRFPPNYIGQTFGVALSGLLLTPIIPSPVGRINLVSPLVMTLSEILGFKKRDPGAVGIAMVSFLGFGLMSLMFMNGAPECLLILGLLPSQINSSLTWGSWFEAALPLGISFFLFSYLAIITRFRPKEKTALNPLVIQAQLQTLGPLSTQEKISVVTVVIFITAFLTQPWHHIDGAWVAMLSFLILFVSSVLDEKAVRADINWMFLISFGAIVGFGNIISESNFFELICTAAKPCLQFLAEAKLVFLLAVTLAVTLLRLVLPLVPGLLVSMLLLIPFTSPLGIHPIVIGLVVLASLNPWFLRHQNMMYLNLIQNTEGKLFSHDQTLVLAFVHILAVMAAVAVSFPYWRWIGLIP